MSRFHKSNIYTPADTHISAHIYTTHIHTHAPTHGKITYGDLAAERNDEAKTSQPYMGSLYISERQRDHENFVE